MIQTENNFHFCDYNIGSYFLIKITVLLKTHNHDDLKREVIISHTLYTQNSLEDNIEVEMTYGVIYSVIKANIE